MARPIKGKANGNGKHDGASRKPIDFVNYVVGVDFLESGDHAFWAAMNMAKRQPGVIVHAVHVVPETGSLDDQSQKMREVAADLAVYTADHGAGIPGDQKPVVNAHVLLGNAAHRMLQLAADVNADMIFVGPHTKGGTLRKMFQGSTTSAVLRSGRVPVVVAYQKNFEGVTHEDQMEPPCASCLQTQSHTGGNQLWCEVHARPRLSAHVYGPTEPNRGVTHDSEVAATGVHMIAGEGEGSE